MFEWIAANADKTSTVTLLMMVVGFLFVAWFREWFILTKTHLRLLSEKDKEMERNRDECKYQREMNERLLAQLERAVTVQERVAPAIPRRAVERRPSTGNQ